MAQIPGVDFEQQPNCYICHVAEFSDELKTLIRKRLSAICHGRFRAEDDPEFYTYRRVLKQFNTLLDGKGELIQKGMVGELLFHVLVVELVDSFRVISPFFNLEEKSIKKGYDVILSDSETEELWITESKSGEKSSEHLSADSKNKSLLKNAKRDLRVRLNEPNTQRWQSALNGVVFTLKNNDKGKLIKKILQGEFIKSESNSSASTDHNVILCSNVFSDLSDKITKGDVVQLKAEIDADRIFKQTILFSIQKNTYQKVRNFLKEEEQDE